MPNGRRNTAKPASTGKPSEWSEARDFGLAHDLKTPLWVYDIDQSVILHANEAACRLWQAATEAELKARDMSKDMSATVSARLKQYQEDFQHGAVFNEMWTLYPNGEPTSVMVFYRGFRLPDGRMAMLCEAVAEVGDTPENLRSMEALLHTDVMISLYTRDGHPVYTNPAARKAIGEHELALRELFVSSQDYDHLLFELDRQGEFSLVSKIFTASGLRWHNLSTKLCSDAATGEPAILVTSNDVTELKNARDKATYLADRDHLTGCFNRSFLQHRMEELSRFRPSPCALVYFDVDRFKQINDRHGHEAGDVVLKKIVSLARANIGTTDLLARLGGDEFVILLEDLPDEAVFISKMEELQRTLSKPIDYGAARINTTVSFGVSFFTPGEKSFTDVLREADIALYASKSEGRNRLTVFSESLGEAARQRDEIEIELKAAVENREFVLFFQPRVDLTLGRVVSVEALVRWQHPRRGLIYPDVFIPICEETGIIEDLGRLVLEEGCRQAFEWQKAGLDIDMSLNVSPRQFDDQRLMATLQKFAATPGFPTHKIELEITENVLIGDHERIARKLEQITELGYRIAIDDFGMGYSNLSYISRFPLECIKIDRSFISQLPHSGPVIRLILTLAQQIGAITVAEGVERAEEVEWLSSQACDQVQGYYFSRPKPLDQLMDVIQELNGHGDIRVH